jgi:tetratricopeptide (TPR) repeat protein
LFIGLSLAAACSKPDAAALFAKGNDYFDKNLIPEAIVQYRQAVQADPKRGDIRAKLADAYLRNRDVGAALKEAVLAADLLPADATAQIRAGNLLLVAGSFEDAKARGDKAVAIDGRNPDALALVGNALAGLKQFDDAISEYQEALALNPAGGQIYANIGAIQLSRGQVKEAEATFRKAVEMAPRSVSARLALAGFLWGTRRPAEAEAALKEALALEPSNLSANRSLGAFYMATGRGAEAEPYFKAVAAAANTDEAQLALADYYLALQRTADARAILNPLSKKPESMGPASLRLAAIEVGQNNRTVAATIVRGVLEKTPKYAPARVFELRLLVMDNKLDEALTAAAALAKEAPNSTAAAEANFMIGTIEANRDRAGEATRAYEEALRIVPQSIPVAISLAQLHLRGGNADKAETLARQILTGQPKNLAARAVIVRACLTRGDLARAQAELASLEADYPNAPQVQNLVAARNLAAANWTRRAPYSKAGGAERSRSTPGLGRDRSAKWQDEGRGRSHRCRPQAHAPSADLHVLAARTYVAAGNAARTEELLKQAIDREPARLAAYSLLGQLFVSQKRLGDARDQYQALLQRNPRSVPANTMLGLVLEAQGNLPAAEAQYQKTLSVDPAAAVPPTTWRGSMWRRTGSRRGASTGADRVESLRRSRT